MFNYDKGESIINLATLAEPDTRWMATSRRGGGPAESGYVMEEPAVGFASKHDTAVGTPKYPPHLSKQKPRTSTTSRQSSPVNEKMPESTLQTNNSFQTNNYFGEMDPAMMEQYKSQYSEQDWNALLLQQQQWMAQYGYQFQPGMYDYKVGDKRGSDQSYDESRKR